MRMTKRKRVSVRVKVRVRVRVRVRVMVIIQILAYGLLFARVVCLYFQCLSIAYYHVLNSLQTRDPDGTRSESHPVRRFKLNVVLIFDKRSSCKIKCCLHPREKSHED